MLSEWLKSGCRPTWEDMISALRSPIVGLQALAIKLKIETGKVPSPPLDLLHSLFLYPHACMQAEQASYI